MRKKILVADPDGESRTRLAEILSDYDADVLGYGRDDEAYDGLLEQGPDLAVIDVLLPRQGGLALLRRMRATPEGQKLPAIVVCAVKGCNDLREEALGALKAAAYLEKPLKPALLRAKIDRILAQTHTIRPGLHHPFTLADPPPQRGTLEQTPFFSLFYAMARYRLDGRLHLQQGKTVKVLYFKEGKIVFAGSNRVSETLGRYLLERGEISEETYRLCLQDMQRRRVKFGEAAAAANAMGEEAIAEAVVGNVRAKILELFTWRGGEFALTDFVTPPAALPGEPIAAEEILWTAASEHLLAADLAAAFRPYEEFFVAVLRDPATLPEELAEAADAADFLAGCRLFAGEPLRTVLERITEEAELRILFALFLLGYLALGSDPDFVAKAGEADTVAQMERLHEARRELNNLKIHNAFRVLGVSLKADDDEVRSAYRERAKQFHPDRAGTDAPEKLRAIYGECFALVQNAYENLKTQPLRDRYLASLQLPPEEAALTATAAIQAETLYQQGMTASRKREWEEAARLLSEAFREYPNEPEYAIAYGVALMNLPGNDRAGHFHEARKFFRRALELTPDKAEPFYRLGMVAKLEGDSDRAFHYFQLALVRDPRHLGAQQEVRLQRARRERKSTGMLGSILGRKGKR